MQKQVLINVEATDLRVANLEDGTLVELFVEHFNNKSILGNIYKGRVEGIVPGLKAVLSISETIATPSSTFPTS